MSVALNRRGLLAGLSGAAALLGFGRAIAASAPEPLGVLPIAPTPAPCFVPPRLIASMDADPARYGMLYDWLASGEKQRCSVPFGADRVLEGAFQCVELYRGTTSDGKPDHRARFLVTDATVCVGFERTELYQFMPFGRWVGIEVAQRDSNRWPPA